VFNYRHSVELSDLGELDPKVWMLATWDEEQEETADLAQIPADQVTADSLRSAIEHSIVATLRAWGLDINDPIHEPAVVDAFLATRYQYWDLDVPHADPFAAP
jgi:hypothetical protein